MFSAALEASSIPVGTTYSSQNYSTSVSSSLESEEKGFPSDLESHGQPLYP